MLGQEISVMLSYFYEERRIGNMSIYDVRKTIKSPRSNVREIMTAKGITILGLVERTQLPKRIIQNSRSEEIKKCKLETLAIIAQGLGVKIKDLFEEE